jgi:hypothetical protein
MRRTDVDDGREENLAGSSPSPVGPDRRLDAVIPFPRRTAIAAASGSAGAAETSSAAPSFQALGPVVQAVVMRLKDNRVRLRVMAADPEEEKDRQP